MGTYAAWGVLALASQDSRAGAELLYRHYVSARSRGEDPVLEIEEITGYTLSIGAFDNMMPPEGIPVELIAEIKAIELSKCLSYVKLRNGRWCAMIAGRFLVTTSPEVIFSHEIKQPLENVTELGDRVAHGAKDASFLEAIRTTAEKFAEGATPEALEQLQLTAQLESAELHLAAKWVNDEMTRMATET